MVTRDTVELTAQQRLVRDSVRDICGDFDAEYWRSRDAEGEYHVCANIEGRRR